MKKKSTTCKGPRSLHIRTGDAVLIIAGEGRSKVPHKVLSVLPRQGKVIVEGVNVMKDSQKNKQQGGRQADINQQNFIEKPYPVDVSNVALVDPASGKRTRVRLQKSDGAVKRIAVKSGQAI